MCCQTFGIPCYLGGRSPVLSIAEHLCLLQGKTASLAWHVARACQASAPYQMFEMLGDMVVFEKNSSEKAESKKQPPRDVPLDFAMFGTGFTPPVRLVERATISHASRCTR